MPTTNQPQGRFFSRMRSCFMRSSCHVSISVFYAHSNEAYHNRLIVTFANFILSIWSIQAVFVATIIQGFSTRPTDVTDSIYITIHIDLRNNVLDHTSHAFRLFAWTLFLVNRMFPVTCYGTFGRTFGGEKNTLN